MNNTTGIFNQEVKSFRKTSESSTKYSGADLVQFNGSTSHFFIICVPDMPSKWRACGGTIPLIDVVETFTIYKGSMRGQPDHPSSGELLSDFGTDITEEVIKKILKEGHIIKGGGGKH